MRGGIFSLGIVLIDIDVVEADLKVQENFIAEDQPQVDCCDLRILSDLLVQIVKDVCTGPELIE